MLLLQLPGHCDVLRGHARIPPASALDQRPAGQHADTRDGHQPSPERLRPARHGDRGAELNGLQGRPHAADVGHARVQRNSGHAREPDDVRYRPAQHVRGRTGVGVEQQDDLVRDERQRVVERHRLALTLELRDQPEASLIRERREDRVRPVGRCVVHDDDLHVGPVEPLQSLHRGRQVHLLVASGQQDRDRRVLVELVEGAAKVMSFPLEGEHQARGDPPRADHDRVGTDEEDHRQIPRRGHDPLDHVSHAQRADARPCSRRRARSPAGRRRGIRLQRSAGGRGDRGRG